MTFTLLRHLSLAVLASLGTLVAPAAQAVNVGVSIGFSQPGVHGRIDIGRYPAPVLVQPRPIIVRPAPGVAVAPMYLWVPPGHQRHWAKHCWRYNACGVPVYFVRDDWYQGHVVRGAPPPPPPSYGPPGRPPGPPPARPPGPPVSREPVFEGQR